jgi:DNA-directed RNA polymerase subunit alpha
MFEHDRSAARGEMATRGLYVFKHESQLGNAPAHKLFERIKIKRSETDGPPSPPRAFSDYSVAVDGDNLPVSENGKLHMQLRVKRGRGYVAADRNFDEDLGIGWIPIDSVHSPVRKVNYLIEAARLGQTTDYDKLTLEVWTNGSVTPGDAVSLAAKLVRDHLNIFINLDDDDDDDVDIATEPARMGVANEHLDKSVEELELSVRSYNCLKNANIRTIRELVQKSETDMLKTKNFGRKSLNEIKEILQTMGLSLGMKLDQPSAAEAP